MGIWWKHFVAAGLAVAVLGAGMVINPAFADPLTDRKAAMKSNNKAYKVIVGYTKGKGDLKKAVAAAKQIALSAKTLPSLFPQGSGMGYGTKTRAKPAIWTDWGKFQKSADALAVSANNFANWAAAGSPDTLKSAAGAIRKSCNGCHKPFRGPKPKKKR